MMNTIPHAPATVPHPPFQEKARNLSLDRTRTFLTIVVQLHHAVIPYTYFGHTDPTSFFGFDMIVLATDNFFMAMFFFLSGLFAWPGISRKGPTRYLADRLVRLGIPFVICAFTIIPVAYYAIALRHDPDLTLAAHWWKTITVGPWPSGPIWFLWALFGFDLVACLLFWLSRNLFEDLELGRDTRIAHDSGREEDSLKFALRAPARWRSTKANIRLGADHAWLLTQLAFCRWPLLMLWTAPPPARECQEVGAV